MKNVIFATIIFIFLGIFSNYVDRNKPIYSANPMVPKTVPSFLKMDSSTSSEFIEKNRKIESARSRTLYSNPTSKDAIETYKKYVEIHNSKKHYECYDKLIFKESSWNPHAQNPKSTAYGLGQFLNKTWDLVPQSKTSNPYDQLDAMFYYVENRYGNACNAWNFWLKNNWY